MRKQLFVLYVLLFTFFCGLLYAVFNLEPEVAQPAEEDYPYDLNKTEGEPTSGGLTQIDPAALVAENNDFQGWLQIPGTKISHPVVQGTDNSFYLNHSFARQRSIFGCLFFDIWSRPGSQSRVIYGHNMGRGREEMFSSLVAYQDKTFAEAHKKLYFTDRTGKISGYEIFAVVNFDITKLTQFDYRRPNFANSEEFKEFVSFFHVNSLYKLAEPPQNGELLILSTCNTTYGENNRLLICAKRFHS